MSFGIIVQIRVWSTLLHEKTYITKYQTSSRFRIFVISGFCQKKRMTDISHFFMGFFMGRIATRRPIVSTPHLLHFTLLFFFLLLSLTLLVSFSPFLTQWGNFCRAIVKMYHGVLYLLQSIKDLI